MMPLFGRELPVADFYDGVNHLGEDELGFSQLLEDKGHVTLAGIVRNEWILHVTALTRRAYTATLCLVCSLSFLTATTWILTLLV